MDICFFFLPFSLSLYPSSWPPLSTFPLTPFRRVSLNVSQPNSRMADAISHAPHDLYQVSHLSLEPQNSFGRGAHWFHESPFLPIGWETTNSSGTASLKHSAMRALMKDQSLLNPELFTNIPRLLAMDIWKSMYQWYVNYFPLDFRCQKRLIAPAKNVPCGFGRYLQPRTLGSVTRVPHTP